MSKALLFAAVTATLAASTAANAAGPIHHIDIGNWHGGSYTDDKTGEFSHCVVNAYYNSGITFFVAVSNNYSWRLGFSHKDWKLNIGQNVPIDLTFDGSVPYRLYATATQYNLILVEMPTTTDIIKRFRAAQIMTAFANGVVYRFVLTNTTIVLPALVQCVHDNMEVSSPTNALNAPPVPQQPGVVSSVPDSSSSPDLRDEALELATNFILGANIANAKVVGRGDTPVTYASFGADWKGSGVAGSVKIVTGNPSMKGVDVAASIVAGDAQVCQGKFASGRSSELINSDVVFRGFSSCSDTSGEITAEYFIVPRKKGRFVVFSILTNASTPNSSVNTQPERVNEFEKAALIATQ